MDRYEAKNVINGTWGECWIDGQYVANITSLQAKVSLKSIDVHMTKSLAKHTKNVGYEGKGSLKLNKVDSMFIKLMSDNMKKGKQTVCTIISKLADPDSFGAERVVFKECVFEELTLANWEVQKNGEESIPFTFADWEVLDAI